LAEKKSIINHIKLINLSFLWFEDSKKSEYAYYYCKMFQPLKLQDLRISSLSFTWIFKI